MRSFLAAAVLALVGGSAQAQYFYQPWVYQRGPNLGGVQYLGNVGNIPVFNPWNMYDNQNYSGNFYARPLYPRRWYPPVFYPTYTYNFGPYGTYYGNSGSIPFQPQFAGVNPGFGIEREAGRFIPLNNSTAVNSITGTVLKPYQGVAYTNEGEFYRIPGTTTLNAYGSYNPATGTYYNPISGDLYNPGTGTIIRR